MTIAIVRISLHHTLRGRKQYEKVKVIIEVKGLIQIIFCFINVLLNMWKLKVE